MVLELDDISEIEELEDLEEGKHNILTEENNVPPTASLGLSQNDSFKQKYEQGIPDLPYCGCEPLECHLLPEPSPIEDMRIDQVRPLYYINIIKYLYRVALVRISLVSGIRSLY